MHLKPSFLLLFLEKVIVVVVVVGVEAGERVEEHSKEVHGLTARRLRVEDDVEHQEDGNVPIVEGKSNCDIKFSVWVDKVKESTDDHDSYDGLCRSFQENDHAGLGSEGFLHLVPHGTVGGSDNEKRGDY